MIEIVVLAILITHVGKIAVDKGHCSGRYQLLTVVLWVGGELLGVIGAQAISRDAFCLWYVSALAGAAVGAGIAIAIVDGLPRKSLGVVDSLPWTCPKCQAVNTMFDKNRCFKCGGPKPVQQEASLATPVTGKASVSEIEARIAAGACPKCGTQVAATDQNCPACKINLAWARQNPGQMSG